MENNNYVRFKQGTIIVYYYVIQSELDHTGLIHIVDHNITNGIRKKHVGARDITTGQPMILSYPYALWTIEELCDTINGYYGMMQYFAGCGKEICVHKKMDLFNRVISLARYINRDITQIPVTVRETLITSGYANPENLINQQMKKILDLSDRVGKISEILETTPGPVSDTTSYYDDDDDLFDDEIDS